MELQKKNHHICECTELGKRQRCNIKNICHKETHIRILLLFDYEKRKLHTHVHFILDARDVNDEPYAMILKAGMIDGGG